MKFQQIFFMALAITSNTALSVSMVIAIEPRVGAVKAIVISLLCACGVIFGYGGFFAEVGRSTRRGG